MWPTFEGSPTQHWQGGSLKDIQGSLKSQTLIIIRPKLLLPEAKS
jgi:hypothetical protein